MAQRLSHVEVVRELCDDVGAVHATTFECVRDGDVVACAPRGGQAVEDGLADQRVHEAVPSRRHRIGREQPGTDAEVHRVQRDVIRLAAGVEDDRDVEGRACDSGQLDHLCVRVGQARQPPLHISSAVTGTSRHYDTASKLNRETKNARIWLGFHFRRAMTDGNELGQRTAAYVADRAFEHVGH